jgi:hypothetical protein
MKCPNCGGAFKSYTAVSLHFRNAHGTAQQLTEIMKQQLIEAKHGGKAPTCACGCGGATKYFGFERGFMEYIRGHASRVKNNWGHNKEALQKSQDVRRQQISDGDWVAWNKNGTKETDSRIQAYGIKGSATIVAQPELLKKRSDDMKSYWETGSIVPLTGPTHSQWRGGSSALQPLARARLHSVWTYPKLRASGFKCQKCGARGPGLEVHHDQERFASILHRGIALFGEVDPTRADGDFERKSSISEWVTDYHLDNDVSGIVLCERCHAAEHEVRS